MKFIAFVTTALMTTTLLSSCAFLNSNKANDTLLKDKNELLSARRQKSNTHYREQEMSRLDDLIKAEKRKTQLRKKILLNLPENAADDHIYAEMIKAFQARDIERLALLSDELMKRYPFSVHADNGLVLVGQLHVSMSMNAEGLRYFEQALRAYPMGNKRPAALIGKAIAYKNLKLYNYSTQTLDLLKKEYPGSPEAFRADLEKRLVEAAKETGS